MRCSRKKTLVIPLFTSSTCFSSSSEWSRHLLSHGKTILMEHKQGRGEVKVWLESRSDTDLLEVESAVIHSKISCYIFFFATQKWKSQQLELLLIYSLGLNAEADFCRLEERALVHSKDQHVSTFPLTQSGQSHTLSGLWRKFWRERIKL